MYSCNKLFYSGLIVLLPRAKDILKKKIKHEKPSFELLTEDF